ncbi:MAG: MFS transporter [Rhizobiales bacterium]|nr:MFS transporter [Hyphomicrobiales bacterium]
MPAAREFLFGPWRAVSVLGVTQIITWGVLFYPPVLTMPLIAAERGWSLSFAMGGFSLALFVGGLVAPRVGALIDRYGGHVVMPCGSLVAAVGLVALVHAAHPVLYLMVWMLLGVAMSAQLYDSAFACLGRIFGAAARQPITFLTLAGGFASTVGWPVARVLLDSVGWRGAYLIYAAVLVLVAAPLHAMLPRVRAVVAARRDDATSDVPVVLPAKGLTFVLVAAAFGAYAFVPSGLSAHLLAIFGRAGIDAATVVMIGALFGPSQVAARLCEFIFARNVHPLLMVRSAVTLLVCAFALLAVLGISLPTAAAFAVMFGMANGLFTIARGTLPLALFGPVGYGLLVGRLAGPWLLMQSVAPLALAFVVERTSDAGALMVVAGFAMAALACLLSIRRPTASGSV